MWNWNHLKGEGWLGHTRRSVKLALLLVGSGVALLLHTVVPFWQQPKVLKVCSVADTICREMEKRD
jgi:hypothetical protein